MYRDGKRKTWISVLIGLVLVGVLFGVLTVTRRNAGRDVDEESITAIRKAVEQSALQCYVVEGAYPPSLSYLQENYGLTVNTKDYLIVYTPFAENLPPDVRVLERNQGDPEE